MKLPVQLFLLVLIGHLVFLTGHAAAQSPPVKEWDVSFGGIRSDDMFLIIQATDGGFLLGGDSDSPIGGQKSQGSQGFTDYWIVKTDSLGNKLWDRRYGGNQKEEMYAALQTADGGYLLGGWSLSSVSGDQTQTSRGARDYWIVKTDMNGNKLWDRRYGGPADDEMRVMVQTADGGYLLAGESASGIGGEKTQPNHGVYDLWIVKIDAAGTLIWDASYGGTDDDRLNALELLADGSFVMGAWTISPLGFDVTQPGKGSTDMWLVKADQNGAKLWDGRYGGTDNEYLYALEHAQDGGFVMAGYTRSDISGDVTVAGQGEYDFWIVKTDENGIKLWDKRYGGLLDEKAKSIYETDDGGFIIGGWSESDAGGDKTEDTKGNTDYWMVKTDADGNLEWDLDIGAGSEERLHDVPQTSDGGFLIGGHSSSGKNGDKSQVNTGLSDYWLVKLSPPGSAMFYYADSDQDGYGNSLVDTLAVSQPAGYVSDNTDCNDMDSSIHPLAADLCNDLDDNCNGQTDENAIIATIAPGGMIEVCKGVKVTLTANTGAGLSYQWMRNAEQVSNATGSTFTTSQQGDYQVMETNDFSCSSLSPVTNIKTLSKPDAIITPLGNLDICEAGSVVLQANAGSNLSYQWTKNSAKINGATNNEYTATTPGLYKVGVTKNNGCKSTSENVQVTKSCRQGASLIPEVENPIRIFPNPNNGSFFIDLPSGSFAAHSGFVEVRVLTLPGHIVYMQSVPAGSFSISLPQELSLSNGMYLLQVSTVAEEGKHASVLFNSPFVLQR